MVLIKEYRIPMPLSVEEYQIAQLYVTTEVSKQETDGDSAIQIIRNEPVNDPVLGIGQYTQKIYHLGSKVPKYISKIAPSNALKLVEESWNHYPKCKTVLTSPFLGDKFCLTIESIHLSDSGTTENVHQCTGKILKHREVINIDIATDHVHEKEYREDLDPGKFSSTKTNRKALEAGWQTNTAPIMCCYKLVTFKFDVFGFQNIVENFFESYQRNLFLMFNRQVFCTIDKWIGLTLEDIRHLEKKTKEELDQVLASADSK
jgi:hypothetical protein